MNVAKLLSIATVMTLGVCSACHSSGEPIRVNTGKADSVIERLARAELSSYLKRMFTNPVEVSSGSGRPHIVAGTRQSNPLIARAVETGAIKLPEGLNSDQGYGIRTVDGAILIAGHTPQGVLYGIYELLEQYGAYFQISGERLPARCAFAVKQFDISSSPVFKYRGLLPWDNFLCGMSAYNYEHYRELVDRAARMKLNMLQFHFYPGLVYFTETWGGKPVDPSFVGQPVDIFPTRGSVGEAAFGGEEFFAPRPYIEHRGNPRAQAEACQRMMRRVIDHARSRGFTTCVGFELMHPAGGSFTYTDKPAGLNFANPVDPHNADLSLARYRSLVETYPRSDFYWMWQSEARGYYGREVGREPGAAEMRARYAHWTGHAELAGDIDYAYLFREVANRLTPEERSHLTTGGWSIEHTFPGTHPDFPKEITFASLNAYHPPSAQQSMRNYRVAQSGRPTWMIEWWEFDGNQWFTQFRAGWQESMYRQCLEYGVEGVTLLGWKLSAVEHNVRYLADFAWNPKLSAAEFYRQYVSRMYGPGATELVDICLEYDAIEPTTPAANPFDYRVMLLGAGWMALGIPALPGSAQQLDQPEWKGTLQAASALGVEHRKLIDLDRRAIAAFTRAMPAMDEQGKSWARLMVNRLEFRVLYLQSMMALNESFVVFDRAARREDMDKARAAAAKLAERAVGCAHQAVSKYAEAIRNRGDQGVVAQLNEQYYRVLKRFHVSLAGSENPYAAVDLTAFRLRPTMSFDFSKGSPWPHRDGKISTDVVSVDGRPTLRLEIGDADTLYNSVFVHSGEIDLRKSPYMDFRIRAENAEPVALMFQLGSGTEWYALNLVGQQSRYTSLDGIAAGKIADGKWHRVTWDLLKLFKDQFGGADPVIHNLILGAWQTLHEPVVVEFQDFALGERNTLD